MSQVGYIYLPQLLLNLVHRQQPQLKGRPLLIGHEGRLLTMSPELRGLVKPGETISRALVRCPEALIAELPSEMADEVHTEWLKALAQAATAIEPLGYEEAFFIMADFYGRTTRQVLQASLNSWGAVIGVAASKMAARLAVHSQLGSTTGAGVTRVIEVKAGEEAAFLKPFRLDSDIFLPRGACQGFKALGINTFAEAQQLSLHDLQIVMGEAAYGVYLYCRGRDQSPVISSYPPGELAVGYTCSSGEVLDAPGLQQWVKAGVSILAARLKEQNQGCQRLELNIRAAGRMIRAERMLASGRYEEASLQSIYRILIEQLDWREEIDQLKLRVSELYSLSYREQDLFALQATRTEADGILATREALALRYPGVFAPPVVSYHREAALEQCDPWRCQEPSCLRGERALAERV